MGRRGGNGVVSGCFWGVGLETETETETASRRAPALGSRFRDNDGWGSVCGTLAGCWCRVASPRHRTSGFLRPPRSPFDLTSRRETAPRMAPAPVGLGTVLGYVAGISRERRLEVCGTRGCCGWGREPFDRLRANGISKRACGVGWWRSVPLRQAQGARNLDTGFRRYDGGGCGKFERRGLAPRRAPALGSRFRGARRWGERDARELLVAERPTTGSGGAETR